MRLAQDTVSTFNPFIVFPITFLEISLANADCSLRLIGLVARGVAVTFVIMPSLVVSDTFILSCPAGLLYARSFFITISLGVANIALTQAVSVDVLIELSCAVDIGVLISVCGVVLALFVQLVRKIRDISVAIEICLFVCMRYLNKI